MSRKRAVFGVLVLLLLLVLHEQPHSVYAASTIEELREKIDMQNQKLKQLELDIVVYESQLNGLGKQKQTLQQSVSTLDISRKKLATDIQVTENRIESTDLIIEELGLDIADKEKRISASSNAIEKAIREVNELGEETFVERLLSNTTFTAMWESIDALGQFQTALGEKVESLQELRIDLTDKKIASEAKKRELTSLKRNLGGQKMSLDSNRKEQNRLLTITKNEEKNYQKLLQDKKNAREAFEAELRAYESELQFAIDPSKIPATGKGVLLWPLDSVLITQYFGNTSFSTSNPQVYNGSGHNGIDLRASPGTPVKASLGGVVEGTGNTDEQRGCYSYGKWVLIRHPNGLSTLYAHFSAVNVTSGEEVKSGDVIGYSGNTGYSTGPHLHFSVFSTQGVRIMKLGEFRKSGQCSNVSIPVASRDAYLNPLSYL